MKWPTNVYIFNLGDAVFLLENMPTEALHEVIYEVIFPC